ncbi:MAG TPA: hypothetical protein VFQ15_04995 [Jiangellaceae bacterium]|nr:hypothetical protein [Jiangellaceae bacterium]
MTDLVAGLSAQLHFVVGDADVSTALGSGDVPVLGTPRLLAWLEAATVAAVTDALADGETTVGTDVALEHAAASPIGAGLDVSAELVAVNGRSLTFEASAMHDDGRRGGAARITRALVDRSRVLARVVG